MPHKSQVFLGYIHAFRAIAILFIVAGHSIDAFDWGDQQETERILRICFSNGTVLFVFIAGYLFQHLSPKYETKKYFIAKLKHVLVPYIIISIPAILIFTLVQEKNAVWEGFYDHTLWEQVALFYLTGAHLAPFWFIPMICLFYLVAPALIWADKTKGFYFATPLLIVLSCFIARGFPNQSFVHFFSVYVLGMFCSRYKPIVNHWLENSTILFLACLSVIVLGIYEYYLMPETETMTYFNLLQKLALTALIMGLLIRLKEQSTNHYLNLIANASFGLFFVHSYLLSAAKLAYENLVGSKAEGDVLGYIFVVMAITLMGLATVYTIKKILGQKSKYLVGS
ncbi:MAG: acyltransferase [Methylococcales bacterium]|nr:acyltransferase [Methylococcales bacterium]